MVNDKEFTLEKMKINDRLTSIELKIDDLISESKITNKIITGGDKPEEGHAFRLASLEKDKSNWDKNKTAIFSTFGLIITGVITDVISHFVVHHK